MRSRITGSSHFLNYTDSDCGLNLSFFIFLAESHEVMQQPDDREILKAITLAENLLCFEDCAICGILHNL
jgi:hypothetical protein